jgi:1-aminocyclopropane-1-carboxylate deaminase/D-cysteine desulfhydrase-like pyridoxal-dependent ACC family enzyme
MTQVAPQLPFGRYPTPVQRVDALSPGAADLWVKRDDLTHEVYGGNKVRKLEHLLGDALARGAKRVVTLGAAGSHHVLATTYFGTQLGLEVEAVLIPQPRSDHAIEVLCAGRALGLRAFPVRSVAAAPLAVAGRWMRGARFIPLGGSSVAGSMGYVDAARELAAQIREGALPEPDICLVALGSGGTAAGLAAGFDAEGLKTVVIAVCVAQPPWLVRFLALRLARGCARRIGPSTRTIPLSRRLEVDERFLGRGYGHATEAGAEAMRVAHEAMGLTLDPTYTAKAFAGALFHLRAGRARHVLYWHTLSSAPPSRLFGPVAGHDPSSGRASGGLPALPSELSKLLL